MTIERRDVDLEFDARVIPRDWCNADAFQTTLLAALSLLFPEGERFFVDSVKRYRTPALPPELARDVVGFIGQEAMHGKEHRAFNAMLHDHGYPSAPIVDRRLRAFLDELRARMPPASQLAVTCALEHFTAMLAERLLADPRMAAEFDPSVRALWLWHALEEAEHKDVAFDVYRAIGGGYARRVAIMGLTTIVFFAVTARVHAALMRERGIWRRPWTWRRGIARLWLYPGYFTRLVPAYLAYFSPRFHPSQRDARALLATWRERLFGPGGALAQRAA